MNALADLFGRLSDVVGDGATLALALAGIALGYLLYQHRWAKPWSGAYRAGSARFADRVTRAARIALGPMSSHGVPLTRADLADLEAFYTRWLNLPHGDREAHREALRRDGIDMIRLGDALRRL